MTLETLLNTIEPYEQVLIIEGTVPFVDKHIYQGLNTYFLEFCRENKLHLMNRNVIKIEAGVNLIYIFIEKEKHQ